MLANFRPKTLFQMEGIHKIMPRDLLKIYNVVSTPGRREFYPHYHSDLEIAYFRTGAGVYSVTGREYPIGEGDIFIFSNNEIHKITYVDPETETRARIFIFRRDCF